MRNSRLISAMIAFLASLAFMAGTTSTANAGIHQTVDVNKIFVQSKSEVPADAELILVEATTNCTIKKVWEEIIPATNSHPRIVNDYILKKTIC